MNKTLITVIGLVAVVGVVLGGIAYSKANQPVNTAGIFAEKGEKGDKGDKGDRGPQGERGPAGTAGKSSYGAVASSDIMTNWFSFGGVRQWAAKRESLATASSTVCAIQGPAATSTLDHASVRFTLASTSAVTVDLAKGTTQYATTTKIGSTYGVAASAQATIVASSTGSVAGDGTIFAPNEWFVVRINEYSSSSGAANAATGVCQARWTNI